MIALHVELVAAPAISSSAKQSPYILVTVQLEGISVLKLICLPALIKPAIIRNR